jgi:hypothetical protein
MRHAATTAGRHASAGAVATPAAATAAMPDSAGSHNACAATKPAGRGCDCSGAQRG